MCVSGTGGPAARELLAASNEKLKAAEMALQIRSPSQLILHADHW